MAKTISTYIFLVLSSGFPTKPAIGYIEAFFPTPFLEVRFFLVVFYTTSLTSSSTLFLLVSLVSIFKDTS